MKPPSRPPAVPFRAALTVREFCEAFRIGRTLFYQLKKEGHIRTIRVGKRLRVPMQEVELWVKAYAA